MTTDKVERLEKAVTEALDCDLFKNLYGNPRDFVMWFNSFTQEDRLEVLREIPYLIEEVKGILERAIGRGED